MIEIDQHTAINSVEQALVPAADLIDARTEIDRLRFIADFGSLINFYDNNNTIAGNWTPFLLKDPVILVASIAKTGYASRYSLYQDTCINLQQLFSGQKNGGNEGKNIVFSLNQLFDQLTGVFLKIVNWTYFMQLSAETYDLKNYVLQQVKTKFSAIFLALHSMREYLNFSKIIPGIDAPRKINFQSPGSTWLENNEKRPYWQVLDDSYDPNNPINKDNPDNERLCFDMLKKAGTILFDFFNTIISNSPAEFERLSFKKSKYPDTTLIRAFVHLLKTQQAQLNKISQKHLEFYYKDILKQTALPAKPDSVYVCAQLVKPGVAFQLPENTLFDAGIDAQKNPILFSNPDQTSLNPATIVSARTLTRSNEPSQTLNKPGDTLFSLYLNTITDTGTIKKDEAGNTLSWETFGGSTNAPVQKTETGIAFASPMFYLPEGTRNLKLTLQFSKESNSHSIISSLYSPRTTYYLSTQKGWYPAKLTQCPLLPISPTDEKRFQLKFDLDETEPAIENFSLNPDGLNADWPMLKIVFNTIPGVIEQPPAIESINIEISVKDLKSFVLYNDNGALSTTTSFPLFGTTPLFNSNFIIGNNEIFSKPLYALTIELGWDPLPENFQIYYQQYNNNLPQTENDGTGAKQAAPGDPVKTTTDPKSFRRKGLFTKISGFFKKLFRKTTNKEVTSETKVKTGETNYFPFNNCCFIVDFKLLEKGRWNPFFMKGPDNKDPNYKVESEKIKQATSESIPLCNPETCPQPPLRQSWLFWFPSTFCPPEPFSFFSTVPEIITEELEMEKPIINPDPALQKAPLSFTGDNLSGFFKMELKAPKEGFGSAIYPKVVTDIALQNALVLKKWCSGKKDLLQPANTPFVPLVNTFKASYRAFVNHHFTKASKEYPLQCFYYSPFTNYKVYDNSPATYLNYKEVATAITGPSNNNDGLPLYPSFNYEGALFVELAQLVPSNTLNLYFQLARNFGNATDKPEPAFYYLSKTTWKKLPVLSDGTKNFSCPGIIEFNIPADIAGNTPYMTGANCWISVAVTSNLSSYSKTTYLNSNGIKLQRSGNSFLTGREIPIIKSDTITKSQTAIPQISSIIQPFPSFNGRAAENQTTMNRRISLRIKTKDRALSSEDYYRLIKQQFKGIYFSKIFYEPGKKCTNVYLVKSVTDSNAANAYTPYVTECEEIKVQNFLKTKASAFANIIVSNFEFEMVKLRLDINLKPGFGMAAEDAINQALKIYLSPWIADVNTQISIGESISAAQVVKFLGSLPGVESVRHIEFLIKSSGKYIPAANQVKISPGKHSIFISAENHCINNRNNCKETNE